MESLHPASAKSSTSLPSDVINGAAQLWLCLAVAGCQTAGAAPQLVCGCNQHPPVMRNLSSCWLISPASNLSLKARLKLNSSLSFSNSDLCQHKVQRSIPAGNPSMCWKVDLVSVASCMAQP
jgi:hypothetical protein